MKSIRNSVIDTKRYDFKSTEKKWIQIWEEENINNFQIQGGNSNFSIDTPPPFTSGSFHMGNILNHAWIDFTARFRRMKGDNVLFPQGFDCHGLPTELKVENYLGRPQTPEQIREFVQECRDWTTKCVKEMKEGFKSMGYSTDWELSYQTMDPEYIKIVQQSLLRSFKEKNLYRTRSPTTFCPKCKTSISRAELTHLETHKNLYYINLELSTEASIIIATTRPELLCSAVAVLGNFLRASPTFFSYAHSFKVL